MRRRAFDIRVPFKVQLFLAGASTALAAIGVGARYGGAGGRKFAAGSAAALAVQHGALWLAMRHVQARRLSLSDLLSLSRGTGASLLAGLAASGARGRSGLAGWLGWSLAIWGIVSDVIDGRVARRFGETRLSSVLDIECDSWLTLWSAAGATQWGGLSRFCLVPGIVRYAHPLLDFLHGRLPVGGGPWWGRATGIAQGVLLLTALAPVGGRRRDRVLRVVSLPISGAQLFAMLWLFRYNRVHTVQGSDARVGVEEVAERECLLSHPGF